MLTPHPTLRRADLLPNRKNDLRTICEQSSLHLTYNARGALYQLLRSLPESKGRTVLLPAFHCTALVEPVARSGFRIVFYRVKPDLSIDLEDLRSKATADVAVIVVIHFFGFPTDLQSVLELRKNIGCYVLEDCAHSFLTTDGGHKIGYRGDFSIYSFYKAVPSLFGGALRINNSPSFFTPTRNKIPWKESAVIGKRLLEQAIENSNDGFLKRTFQRLEDYRVARKRVNTSTTQTQAAAPAFVDDPYLFREDLALAKMPAMCRYILRSSDWKEIFTLRRRNYEVLNKMLQESVLLRKLFPELPEGVCPWAYPVLLQDRLRYEHSLRARHVPLFTFGEILHPLLAKSDAATRETAESLSLQLLMLPVHQNLSPQDVTRYAEEINRFIAEIENNFPAAAERVSSVVQLSSARGVR